MRPPVIPAPALFTDDDLLAVDLEIEEAARIAFVESPEQALLKDENVGQEWPEVAANAKNLLPDDFFESMEALSDKHEGDKNKLPSSTNKTGRQVFVDATEADTIRAVAMAAVIVSAVTFATVASAGDQWKDIMQDTAPAIVLIGMISAAAFGFVNRIMVAFTACIHAVYLARVSTEVFGSTAETPWTGSGLAIGTVVLLGAMAVIIVPSHRKGSHKDKNRVVLQRCDPHL